MKAVEKVRAGEESKWKIKERERPVKKVSGDGSGGHDAKKQGTSTQAEADEGGTAKDPPPSTPQ